jgi:arginine-tRNA-protein transferase
MKEHPFLATPPHPCQYLPNQQAVTLFADPRAGMRTTRYGQLAELGFRRSGADVYRPMCPDCQACVPVRIPVAHMVHRRRERRVWQRNADLRVSLQSTEFRNEHYELYGRYLAARHPGGGMDQPTPEGYLQFLRSPWCETRFVEFRREGQLLAVAVTDELPSGLSAVYTFYEPAMAQRSLGTFTILWQVAEARRRGLPWLFLGYWIEACDKMRYKGHFRPLQALEHGAWRDLP